MNVIRLDADDWREQLKRLEAAQGKRRVLQIARLLALQEEFVTEPTRRGWWGRWR